MLCFGYSLVNLETVFTEARRGSTLTVLCFEIAYSLLKKILYKLKIQMFKFFHIKTTNRSKIIVIFSHCKTFINQEKNIRNNDFKGYPSLILDKLKISFSGECIQNELPIS